MKQTKHSLQRLTLITAWSISILIGVIPPTAYFLISYEHLRNVLEFRTELIAGAVTGHIVANPEMWRHAEVRLSELLERNTQDAVPETKRILDISGSVIATNNKNVPTPTASYRRNIYDAGTLVGRIEVSRSLLPLLFTTLLVAASSTIIAAILLLVLRTLPLRIITKAFQALEESERKYRSLYETMKEGMALHRVDFDENGVFYTLTVIDANPSCMAMFDGNQQKVIGSNSFALFGDSFREFLSELLQVLEHGDTISFELCLPGTDKFYNVQAFSPDKGLIATLFEDITERRKTEQHIQKMAYFDNLTGLPNRALFFDRLNQAMVRANREKTNLAVLFLDLDRFKSINDTLGHAVGDQLLIEVTQRLNRHIRSSDTLARLGGDEFVIIATNLVDKLDASYIAQNLIDSIQPPFQIMGHELHVTTSIGIALFPDDGGTTEILIKHADMAMYSSKESGRNAFNFYSPFMNRKAIMRMEVEEGLRNALERNEFFLEYQPIINAASGAIVAAEALLRWNHPTRGRLAPDQFIPLAEETGLILPMGEWVLREACLTMKAWSDAGLPPIRVAVNVSSRQVEQQNFVEIVENILRDTGANASQLEIELAENTLVTHIGKNIQDAFRMREWGISVAIDDFGTGYSSLGSVKTLPIDHIKIDRSFIKDVITSGHNQAVVETILIMSQKLGIKNIAEGVETADQVRFLQAQGCNEIQGFFYHHPLQPKAFEALLREQAASWAA